MWFFGRKGPSGFSSSSTAEEVTYGIDGSGLTAIVTGATSGIGAETARVLAKRGVHVVMAVRNMEKGVTVRETILTENPNAKVDVMELELSSQASVWDFAAKYRSSGLPLNILINNAGILSPGFKLSRDGIELHFATNHLGHHFASNRPFDGRLNRESSYNTISGYPLSKLANILHANELARRLKEEGVNITANSLHPGAIMTEIFHGYNNVFVTVICKTVLKYFMKDVSQGAATTCYLALNPKVKGVTGAYFSNCNLAKPSARSENEELAKELWEFSLGLTSSK